MILLDGKALAEKMRDEMRVEVSELHKQGIIPNLGVILVGEFAPSMIYVRNKENACADVGITTQTLRIKDDITEEKLINIIEDWNQNKEVNGILVQMPLPKHIEHQKVLDTISPLKDVDGLSVFNLGRLLAGQSPYFYPCTPLGIVEILKSYNISTEGKHCVIVGRGELVGKPLANMLLRKEKTANATVTVCHSKTPDISYFTKQADIVIVAIGQAQFLKRDMVKQGTVIVDVGVNRINVSEKKTKLVGDVDFEAVKDLASAITPVPGGVGPMTVTMLLKNTIQAAKIQNRR
ncbi:MAG: bifunctional methylenetetrahydrofolate dehydrogenase/methenyltetrahydrofolate cyclohydrolase FolD [Candidatus Latescibacteria bacterium]|nr:bifunctional methylenetetrahydrofolate dehydrogenase/methenyltetrahydrofolate cyclohydrolase FolD [Candidatus Latescibacterota bacterium]